MCGISPPRCFGGKVTRYSTLFFSSSLPFLSLSSVSTLSLLCLCGSLPSLSSPLSVWVSALSSPLPVWVSTLPYPLSSVCVGLCPSPALSPLSISLVDYKSGYLSVAMEIVMFKVSSCVGFPLLEYKVC